MNDQDLNSMKTSALLKLALTDLRKVEQDPQYEVDMMVWHAPLSSRNVCQVCLAGAVLAKTCRLPPTQASGNMVESREWVRILDSLRVGEIGNSLDGELPDSLRWREEIPRYEEDPVEFHNQLQGVVYLLEREGL